MSDPQPCIDGGGDCVSPRKCGILRSCLRHRYPNGPDATPGARRMALWPDYAGNPIYEGDTIQHPESGQTGTVVFLPDEIVPRDQWRVDYHDGLGLSRLQLQVGEKGRAVVVTATKESP